MAITRTKLRGKEMILIEGKVDGFYINEIPADKIKSYAGKDGAWTPTHRYNLVVEGERISLGMGDKDGVSDRQQIRAKDNDGNYHTLAKGLEVSVEVTENGEWNGKTQYQSTASKVVVLDASGAVQTVARGGAAGAPQAAYTGKPKDTTGISTGHAINGAMNFLLTWGVEASNENIIRYGTSVHNITEKLKTAGKIKYPEMSEYDLGAMVGHSVLNACKLVGTDVDFETGVEGIAEDLLANVVPVVQKHIKEGKAAPAAPKTTRAAPKKATGTRAKVVEPEPEVETTKVTFDDMDDDSDVPF